MKKTTRLLKKTEVAMAQGQFAAAIVSLNELLETNPTNISYLMMRGEAHLRSENYEAGLIDYAKIVEADNTNIVALINFAAALIRCNQQNDAREILDYVLDLDPENFDANINLCNVFQSLGKPEEALKTSFKAIQIRPDSYIAYNNLGTALGDLNMDAEAREAFITANLLNPEFVPTIINLSQLEIKLGRHQDGINLYNKALTLHNITENQSDLIKYYLAYSYLFLGDLENGWDHYEYGFGPLLPKGALRSLRKFHQPKWNGENISGKKLLIWREQGLGDEIEFSTCLADIESLSIDAIVETDPRLVSILKRAYPKLRVRAESIGPDKFPTTNDFDVHIPIGSLPKFFRRNIKSFKKKINKWDVLKEHTDEFALKLSPFKKKKLVGICWRSGLVSLQRNDSYTGLNDWRELLIRDEFIFVNLQYGDCEQELVEAEKLFNIKIIRWPDLDLKDDLERLIALINNLDCVVTVGTAVSSIASSIGKLTILLSHPSWTMLGERNSYPWYDCIIPLIPEPNELLASKIKTIPHLLANIK